MREFIQYWKKNFRAAKELSEFWVAVVIFGVFIVGLLARFFGFRNPSEVFTLDVKIELIGGGLTAFFCFVWLPFHRHQVERREHKKVLADTITDKNSEIQRLEIQLHKIKSEIDDDKPKLRIDAELQLRPNPPYDMQAVLKIRITNLGKHVARIKSVYVFGVLASHNIPISHYKSEHPFTVEHPEPGEVVSLPDGDLKKWEKHFNPPPILAIVKDNKDAWGQGYVELTSGQRFKFRFKLPSENQWRPKIAVSLDELSSIPE